MEKVKPQSDRIFNDPDLSKLRATGELVDTVEPESAYAHIEPIVREHTQPNAPRPVFGQRVPVGGGGSRERSSGSTVLLLLGVSFALGVLMSLVVGWAIGMSAATSLYIILLITFIAVKD